MLWIPQSGLVRVEHNMGSITAGTPGTSVTTGAASGTKGTPAQVFAATLFDAYWVTIMATNLAAAATASEGCLDLLIGAATEEVLVANMLCGHAGGGLSAACGPKRWDFPLYIPGGSRLAVQAASVRTATGFRVRVYLYGGNGYPAWRVGNRVDTYGVSAVPNGVAITPGNAVEGAWAEITASTSVNHFAFVPSFQATGDTTMSTMNFAIDMGLGAATEQEFASSYGFRTDSSEFMEGPLPSMPAYKDIPSGTRLVMRAACSGAPDAGYNGAIHAVS